MKKMKIILLAIITTSLAFSCGNDDDSSSSNSIIGTWQWVSSIEDGENDPLTECDLLNTIEFTDTQLISVSNESDNGSAPCTSETSTFTYTIEDNTLSLTVGDEITILGIVTLNSTTLVLRNEDTFNGETSVTVDTYTRQ